MTESEGTPSERWWLTSGQTTEGPFPAEFVTEWLQSGQIRTDAMACREGTQTWVSLAEIPEFAKHVVRQGPALPPTSQAEDRLDPPIDRPPMPPGRHEADFSMLNTSIIISAVGVGFELLSLLLFDAPLIDWIALCTAIAGLVTWLVFHYRLWTLIPNEFAETTPERAVGFLFIPIYNFYWVFISCQGAARGLNRCIHSQSHHRLKADTGLATAYGVTVVASIVLWPLIGSLIDNSIANREFDTAVEWGLFGYFAISVPHFVFWILMVLNQKKVIEYSLTIKAPINLASGLIRTHWPSGADSNTRVDYP